ncbi:hypothetical protein NECAME_08080 [Necator americanus]|uniref:Uncharacterized protein n=1 Tax=Necator americanus TaxID=51031 RepID=W2TM48_NECAM|nr:hypothetical protein NECAME_08080 [Necator americanus]ETN82206.1 hypothetical protein NECAME_08080 [Necator americanus]
MARTKATLRKAEQAKKRSKEEQPTTSENDLQKLLDEKNDLDLCVLLFCGFTTFYQIPITAQPRHSTRIRKPTVIHVAPDFVRKGTSKKRTKGIRRKGKAEVVVIEKKGKSVKTRTIKGRQEIKLQKKVSPS